MAELSNNERILQVANALEELNKEVVYVGGAVIQLYSTDPGIVNPITTYDVDCVVDITSYPEYHVFEEKLFSKHFSNDISEGAPICRYLLNGEKVDFMPKVDTGIGVSNRWYEKGIENRQEYKLSSGRTIFLMPVPYYLASKFDALHSRGGNDYRGEKDFEDIVFVLNSCARIRQEVIGLKETDISEFLRDEFTSLIKRGNIREEIECALLEEGRVDYVLSQIKELAAKGSRDGLKH